MGEWPVKDGSDGHGLLFVVKSLGDGTISLHIPSPDPVVVSRKKAEEIRLAIGSAISDESPS